MVACTPDHIHAPASLMAMRLGKHVYREKPVTWSIKEARRMAQVAKEKRVATQMGTQGMHAQNRPDADRFIRRQYRKGWEA